jgi:hypothetical protein
LLATTSGQTIKPIAGPVADYGNAETRDLEEDDSGSLSIYPNPAREELNIRLAEGASVINVYSITGRLMLSQNVTAVQEKVDISKLQPGTYFIAVEVDGEMMYERFVKM